MAKYNRDSWEDADVLCPFYISKERRRRLIRCEGCTDSCENTLIFSSIEAQDSYMGRYCVSRYQDCPISRAANSKYE